MAGLKGVKIELSSEELYLLKNELVKSEYAGLGTGQKVTKLNYKPLINNPESQGQIQPSTIVSIQEILELISWENLKKLKKHTDGAIALSFLNNLGQVNLAKSNVQAAIADVLQAELVSQVEVDALNAKIAPIPDPNWQIQIPGQSKTEELLGIGYVVEGDDVKEVEEL